MSSNLASSTAEAPFSQPHRHMHLTNHDRVVYEYMSYHNETNTDKLLQISLNPLCQTCHISIRGKRKIKLNQQTSNPNGISYFCPPNPNSFSKFEFFELRRQVVVAEVCPNLILVDFLHCLEAGPVVKPYQSALCVLSNALLTPCIKQLAIGI